ncbi:MAG TPA: flagellar basal body P-ring formation chaperone FlgA [Anaerohalosphaeraceae bacterium]|nr:flagellar basal body P-ring formation chaperone FlgA [Anaerohalosphaeraceae bacterium]HPB94022.1 flagellar basal body P-ring formation chaperone FlgA [Anaerohalosphaeraceae bacterium]HRT22452.1 flagellar basal body P-ring formation chaperone FlgA [Anaerohalosphaeraceae bacterium]
MKLWAILSCALFWTAAQQNSGQLEIYLPRTVQIEGEVIELGQIGLLQGSEEMAAAVRGIQLGRFSMPGQQIILDRQTLQSCLAGGGISPEKIRLMGAEQVAVTRTGQKMDRSALVEAAQTFLQSQLAAQEVVIVGPVSPPSGCLLKPDQAAEVVPVLGTDRTPGRRTVVLSIRQEGKETERILIPFEVRFRSRQVIAATDIAVGQVISPQAVRLETAETPEPQSVELSDVVGAAARRAISAGTAIRPQWLQPPTPPVLIQRRQKVVLKLDTGLMLITASGEALDEGTEGQVIRIKRGQRPDERIVLGKVMPDGTVRPLYGKADQ